MEDDQPIPGIDVMARDPWGPIFQIFWRDDPPYLNSPFFWETPKRPKPWKRKQSGKDRTQIKAARKQNRNRKK